MRCSRCFMPDTRPGSVFTEGVCQACLNFDKRGSVNWVEREEQFDRILADHVGGRYDCLIPVSGGKDSHRIVYEIKRRGLRPLLCTVNDSFTHTEAGTANLRNLVQGSDHIEYTINHDLFTRGTRWAFEDSGEALRFVEYAIYTVPWMIAQMYEIPLVIFGENSAFEYGPVEDNFYSANDVINGIIAKAKREVPWWKGGGVTEEDIASIMPKPGGFQPQVLYLSFFYQWSSITNLKIARKMGFKDLTGEWDRKGTIENFEQIDSKAYMVHLWLKYPKFGFQRVSDIASRRVREGALSLKKAKALIWSYDHILDPEAMDDFCQTLGYTPKQFWGVISKAKWNVYHGKQDLARRVRDRVHETKQHVAVPSRVLEGDSKWVHT